jgi:hypothetical protein
MSGTPQGCVGTLAGETQGRQGAKENPSGDPSGFTDRLVFAEKNKKRRKKPECAFEVERFSPEDCNRQ